MKQIMYLAILLFFAKSFAQEPIELKDVNSKALKERFEKSNYQLNIILTYLKENFKTVSEKYDIQKAKELDNAECGFSINFERNLTYTINECEEGKGVRERIVFPPAHIDNLKKWVEQINAAYPTDIKNVWNNENYEYAPKDREAGCYYTITQSKVDSIIEIWCGS